MSRPVRPEFGLKNIDLFRDACRAEPVRKTEVQVRSQVGFQGLPVLLLIPHLLALRTDGYKATQRQQVAGVFEDKKHLRSFPARQRGRGEDKVKHDRLVLAAQFRLNCPPMRLPLGHRLFDAVEENAVLAACLLTAAPGLIMDAAWQPLLAASMQDQFRFGANQMGSSRIAILYAPVSAHYEHGERNRIEDVAPVLPSPFICLPRAHGRYFCYVD